MESFVRSFISQYLLGTFQVGLPRHQNVSVRGSPQSVMETDEEVNVRTGSITLRAVEAWRAGQEHPGARFEGQLKVIKGVGM